MKTTFALGLLALCVALPLAALAGEGAKGQIFPPSGSADTPIFLYENSRLQKGDEMVSSTRYLDPAGKELVEEIAYYENGKLRRFRQNQLQTEETSELEIKDERVHYTFTARGSTKTDQEKYNEEMLVPDMIGDYIRSRWEELNRGDTVKVRILLPERLDSIGFKFFKDKDREYNGKAAVEIILKPSSIFIAALAPSIRIIVEKDAPHRLLETVGRLPIRMPKVDPPRSRRDLKAIDGRLVFEYPKTPDPVTP
jgi:hypothetical protein